MTEWLSPVNALLRSCARASGAMQKGLDRAASSQSSLGAFDPVFWIGLATEIISAALASSAPPGAPEPVKPVRHALRVPAPKVSPGSAAPSVGQSAQRPEVLQALIDQDVYFLIFSIPEKKGTVLAIPGQGAGDAAGVIGLHVNEALHRFNVFASAASSSAPLTAGNTVGERAGACTWRWLFMPDDFRLAPGREPPATKMRLDAPQRFAMVDGLLKFGEGGDGFRGTGEGQTAPVTVRGRKQLSITATGTLSEGFGKFKNRENGLFIYCGLLDPARGFQGSLTLRVADPRGTLQTTSPLPPLQAAHNPEQGVTWLTIRAQAILSASVAPLTAQDGQLGMILQQEAQLMDIDFAERGPNGLECAAGVRPAVGQVTSRIAFDPKLAAGTPQDPLPFAVWREFSFVDFLKNPVGGFTAESSDGIALVTDISGVKGIRFGGTGRILKGSGRFEGMSGVITENTLAVLDPYAGSSLYTLRVDDPLGRFSAHEGVWRDIPVSEVVAQLK